MQTRTTEDMSPANITEEGCVTRFGAGALSGVVAGVIYGGINSAWTQNPAYLAGRKATLRHTNMLIGRYAGLFGVVGATYGAGSCFGEAVTGGKGAVSAGIGGALAGAVLGIPAQSVRIGCGAAAAMAAASALADIFDRRLSQKGERDTKKLYPNW